MALPRLLAALFTTASLANGLNEFPMLLSFRAPPTPLPPTKKGNHPPPDVAAAAASPIITLPAWMAVYGRISGLYHGPVHLAALASMACAMYQTPGARTLYGVAMALDVAHMVSGATWAMGAVRGIQRAEGRGVEVGDRALGGLLWVQLVRVLTVSLAATACCVVGALGVY